MRFLIGIACIVVIVAGGWVITDRLSAAAEARRENDARAAAVAERSRADLVRCKAEVARIDAGQEHSDEAIRRFGPDGVAGYLDICRGLIQIDEYRRAAQ